MSLAPSPSAARGDLLLQPPFFSSSLFTTPFRADVTRLIDLFVAQYSESNDQPFALFKHIWKAEGWVYMHLKVFDARTRDAYLRSVCRLFVERMEDEKESLHRVVALFALYTFFSTQPPESHPPLYVLKHVEIAIDTYTSLLCLPKSLEAPELAPLAPYVSHILAELSAGHVFRILPSSSLAPYNPRALPREIFVNDDDADREVDNPPEAIASSSTDQTSETAAPNPVPKKKGRPSKRDIAKKTRDAVAALDKWLDRTNDSSPAATPGVPSHSLITHAPTASRSAYTAEKTPLVDALREGQGAHALERANIAVLGRLKRIDAMAAEQGMEVGGEGGEKTGLSRVEKAVGELNAGKGGILGLLEGAGMGDSNGEGGGE